MRILVLAAILALGINSASAQHADHSAGAHGAHEAGEGPSTQAYREANARMHEAMDVELTGDADIDFVRSMIPHHEGAIAMAQVVIDHGDDTELQALAREIVSAQEAEIAEMRAWLSANDPAAAAQ